MSLKSHGVNIPAVGGTVTGPAAGTGASGGSTRSVQAVAAATSQTSDSGGFALPAPGSPRKGSVNQKALSIPADWKQAYVGAAKKFGLPWTLLAGIGMEETAQGRNIATSVAGAQGPMQFLPSTFASVGVDGDGDGVKDINSVPDAIYSAANYLTKSGVKGGADGVRKAIRTYNHADWYVNDVLYYAQQYGGGTIEDTSASCSDGTTTSTKYGAAAIAAAKAWMGQPYVLGGGTVGPPPGPTTGVTSGGGDFTREGFDCSGLAAAVVAQATNGKLKLPHLSTSQYTTSQLSTVARYSGTGTRPLSELQPGDVIVFNIPLSLGFDSHPWNHVGIYIGDGKMINAAKPGTNVRVDNIKSSWNYPWVARRPLATYTQGSSSS